MFIIVEPVLYVFTRDMLTNYEFIFGMLFYARFRMIIVILTIVNVIFCRSAFALFVHPLSCIYS
jgi:hypothetical protein